MTETRKIFSDELRVLCIKKNWYTKGTNEEYSRMFALANKYDNVKTATIVNIAEDILFHSDTDYPLSSICFEIAEICHSVFE